MPSTHPAQPNNISPAAAPQITNVTLAPATLNSGDVLNVSITVRNDSAQTLATQ
jgi:hypothetical protein